MEALRAVAVRVYEFAAARHLALFLKVGVSIGLIALVCRNIDGAALGRSLVTQSLPWVAATILLGLVQIALLSLRWQQILRGLGGESSLRSVLAVTFMGCFFGAFLFGPTGGDVARAVLAPPLALDRRGIVHSVLIERLASMVGLGLAAAPLVILDIGPMAHSLPLVLTIAVIPLAVAGMALLVLLARDFGGRNGAVFFALRDLDHSWRRIIACWPRLAAAIAIAALGQALVAVEVWCLARSLQLDVSLANFAVLMPPVMLLVALPISAGGWGVRESAMVTALALVGVGATPALLLSVEFGLIGTLVSLPGGGFWLHRLVKRRKPPISLA